MKSIIIITTIFNEEECINDYVNEIINIKKQIKDYNVELLFIDNGSNDNSYNIIVGLIKTNPWIKVIKLVRNFGYQNALFCGLENSKGDYFLMLDVDMEDPPKMLVDFIEIIKKNYSIAYGIRKKRDENIILLKSRNLWYRIFNMLSDHNSILYMSEFALITKNVKKVILSNKSSFVFIRNEISYSGYPAKGIEYSRKKRLKGVASSSSLIYIFQFALAGIIDSTTKPLRIVSFLCLFNLLISFLFFLEPFHGVFIFLTICNFIFSISIISVYLARIKNDLSNKQKYIIDQTRSIYK